jgi:hypothetical protein
MRTKIVDHTFLYKWTKNFANLQSKFYNKKYKLKRIHDIETFINKKGYKNVFHVQETRLDIDIPLCDTIDICDLVLVTHQGYSRMSCRGIIEQIKNWTSHGRHLYFCLNRHYLNIDNSKIDIDLPQDYQSAIVTWLKSSLENYKVEELSDRYIDRGKHFTWSIPDKHFLICRI